MDDTPEVMTESPEEKAFFEQQGAETVTVEKTEPELPLETEEPAKAEESKKPEHVPLATYLEERNEWKRKFGTQEQRLAKLQDLINAQFGPKPPEQEVINPETDPIKAIQNLAQELETLKEEKKLVGEVQAIAQFGQRQAQAFAQEKPDFYDAYNHLRQARANQLLETGTVQSPQELNNTVLREEQDILKMCARMQIDPARFMYNLAMTAGYTPQQAQQQTVQAPSQEEKIKIQSQGQQRAAATASKMSSGSGGPIDLKALVNLSEEEFDKATSGSNWKKIMGG